MGAGGSSHRGGLAMGGVWLWGGLAIGGGRGHFGLAAIYLHYHMVLRPKGTSHNECRCFLQDTDTCVNAGSIRGVRFTHNMRYIALRLSPGSDLIR